MDGPERETATEFLSTTARREDPFRIESGSDPADPDREPCDTAGLLLGPEATLAGSTFDEWLAATEIAVDAEGSLP